MMLLVFKAFFILSFIIIIYTYIGYPLIVWLLVQAKKAFKKQPQAEPYTSHFPAVTLVVAAYNEEEIIEAKIINSLQLDYPKEAIKFLFISDGSSDKTSELIAGNIAINHLYQPERKGKLHAMDRAMALVKTPLVVFSDANSMLNKDCIKSLVRHYVNPVVGGVAGEKKVLTKNGVVMTHDPDPVATGEGLYWRYESFLKKLDAELYSVVGAAGELFSMRTALYEHLPAETILEDFVQSLRICQKGYVIKYDDKAYAAETATPDLREEIERKIRISAGGFQAIGMLKSLLLPFRNPLLSFQYISHRVLRWTLTPLSLVIFFISSLGLWMGGAGAIFGLITLVQVAFNVLALIGWWMSARSRQSSLTHLPFYFLMMNFCVFAGFIRWLRGKQGAVWVKARRS